MTNEKLRHLTATEALTLFKARKLSPRELLSALITRAERVNPAINCFADRYLDEALTQAELSEQRYMKRGARLRPREGIPLAVKDAPFHPPTMGQGMHTSFGATTSFRVHLTEAEPGTHSIPLSPSPPRRRG